MAGALRTIVIPGAGVVDVLDDPAGTVVLCPLDEVVDPPAEVVVPPDVVVVPAEVVVVAVDAVVVVVTAGVVVGVADTVVVWEAGGVVVCVAGGGVVAGAAVVAGGAVVAGAAVVSGAVVCGFGAVVCGAGAAVVAGDGVSGASGIGAMGDELAGPASSSTAAMLRPVATAAALTTRFMVMAASPPGLGPPALTGRSRSSRMVWRPIAAAAGCSCRHPTQCL